MIIAIANGTFREARLRPRLGERKAHIVSTILLSLLIGVVSWLTMPWIAPASSAEAVGVGTEWLLMTLIFEFGFGRLVAKKSWSELLSDYHLTAGRIWVLVLITTFMAPLAMAHCRGLIR